jgi:hypothetical protein
VSFYFFVGLAIWRSLHIKTIQDLADGIAGVLATPNEDVAAFSTGAVVIYFFIAVILEAVLPAYLCHSWAASVFANRSESLQTRSDACGMA